MPLPSAPANLRCNHRFSPGIQTSINSHKLRSEQSARASALADLKRSELSFWVAALVTNLIVAFFCIAPNMNSVAFSLVPVALLVIATPTIVALGTAWLVMSTRDETNPRPARNVAGCSVLAPAVLPIVTLWTLWPLHLAFRAARPDLERLVNQVAAGRPVRFPRRVSLFNLTAAAVVPRSGHVGLRIYANGANGTGLVRINAGAIPKTYGPFLGVNFDVYMGGGWWYRG
jgi:hypothetical protein